ncbi:MAG: 2-C-methyl-D-erythritol 2,4-cyclodiphosphate synthase [Treponemataceae bacterium]|nr:2-C-methyl-D-erythritol 2,4-cyclodiphosphate synthase [Treponemataceae bacterium]
MKYSLIIAASGSSSRMGTGQKKEYLPMTSPFFPNEKASTVLSCVAEAFLMSARQNPKFKLCSIIFTYPENTEEGLIQSKNAALSEGVKSLSQELDVKLDFLEGGSSRQISIFKALKSLEKSDIEYVAIHDGARPWIDQETIINCLECAAIHSSASPVIPLVDTIKELDTEDSSIKRHLERSKLGAIQTPQIFEYKRILEANLKAMADNFSTTDDSEIWSQYSGKKAYYCQGNIKNKKITYINDIEKKEEKMTRIGLGYDLHALVQGRDLMLGGIKIESDLGEDGHSDGDVLLHAITDCLLGASGLGDIGEFFPPSDPQWKNADSKMLLAKCWEKICADGWKLGNLDCVIAIEKPKILCHRQEIIESIASVLNVEKERIFIKAKTGEKLGVIGTRQAVAVWATALLEK